MKSEVIYDILAIITMLPTELGGRTRDIATGYKPSFMFNTSRQYSGELRLIEKSVLNPGESAEVEIKLLPATHLKRGLKFNDAFTIQEGSRTVGNGVIKKIIRKRERQLAY